MSIRILTGVLMTEQPTGEATITYNPHEVRGDATGVGLYEAGPRAAFREPPGKMLALRELPPASSGPAKLDEKQFSEHEVKVAWSGATEISYIVFGEVDV